MKRKDYIDYVKAIGIILVVLGHAVSDNTAIKSWIYSFHMPLFFFATGLSLRKVHVDVGYVTKKLKGLLVPYCIWGPIFSGFSFLNLTNICYGSHQSLLIANSLTSLWFLPTMFLAVLISQVTICKISRPVLLMLFASVIFILSLDIPQYSKGYPWGLDVAIMMAPFIIAGYLFETIMSSKSKWDFKLFWGFILFGLLVTITRLIIAKDTNGYVLVAERRIGNPVLFVIGAIGGCLFVYGLSRIIREYFRENVLISFVGRNTLSIFVIHKVFINIFDKIFSIINAPYVLELVITYLGTLVASCISALVINEFAPNLAGKNS